MPGDRATSTGRATDSLQAQINALGDRMDRGLGEIKELLQGVDGRIRRLENQEAGCQPLVNTRLDQAFRQLDEHSTAIKALEDTNNTLKINIAELQHANKILTWIGGLLGSAIIAWLISQFLGMIK